MQNNKLNKEEQAFRDKLNQATFTYKEGDWKAIKENINTKSYTPNHNALIKAAAAMLTATIIVLSLQYYYSTDSKSTTGTNAKTDTNISEFKNDDLPKNNKVTVESKVEKKEKDVAAIEKRASEQKEPLKSQQKQSKPSESAPKTPLTEIQATTKKKDSQTLRSSFSAFISIDGKRCLGNYIKLIADCDESGRSLDYIWTVDKKEIKSKSRKIEILLDKAGNYNIDLQIVNQKGKLLSDIKNSFKVEAAQEIDFTYKNQKGILNDFEVVFEVENYGKELLWTADNQEIELTNNSTYNFGKAGVYKVEMKLISAQGCISEVEKPVTVNTDFKPLINAFTPNDDGKNDDFMPIGFDDFDGYFMFSVYKLNGTLIYETAEPSKAWNGKLNNSGELMPEGNYIWKIEVKKDGKQRTFSDRVKLLIIK